MQPQVAVKGKGLMPYCHFELEASDYITGSRRNPELRGPKGPYLTLSEMSNLLKTQTIYNVFTFRSSILGMCRICESARLRYIKMIDRFKTLAH